MNDGLGYKLVQTLDERPDFREGYLTELLDWYGERYPVIAEDLRSRIANRTRPQNPHCGVDGVAMGVDVTRRLL